jgi:hypothetical protein
MTRPVASPMASLTPPCRDPTASSVPDDLVRTPKSGASCDMVHTAHFKLGYIRYFSTFLPVIQKTVNNKVDVKVD